MNIKSASLLIGLLSCIFLSAETLGARNNEPVGLPTISGIAKQGQVLTADVSAISDADGWAKGKKGKFKYQWLRAGVDIGKATDSTYTLVQADVGGNISIKVSYVDGGGTTETLISAETAAVANSNDDSAGLPSISGIAKQGQVLTANTLGISDADGLGAFSYQWLRDAGEISGATASTYTLVQADVGSKIRVKVSYVDGGSTTETLISAVTATVTNTNDDPAGLPAISGIVKQGQVLTANTLGISDADGLGAFSYQWLRDGVEISGATASTHTLEQADVGSKISVRVSYIDGGGMLESVTSVATTAVTNVNDDPVGLPTISGIVKQGQVLTADTLGISDADGLGAFSYQWLRDDAEISGATARSYTLEQADVETFISVIVSYTDAGFADESVLGKALGPVKNINDIGVVTIAGQATEASTVYVDSITDADGSSSSNFIYQWLRDGKVIVGATASTYKLVQADVGKKVSLRVVYTDDLGADENVISNEIGPVFSDLPGVTAPVLNPVNATGWFTFVDIGQAVAFDALDGPLTATSDSSGQFRPGETTVTWSATDLAGNVGTATQSIKVVPLVEVSKNQRSTEGDSVDFKVILNGDALVYPVKVPYFVSGTADGNDHTLKSGEVRIDQPASGELPEKAVSFNINDNDGVEGLETIVITLGIPTNAVLGPVTTHTVEIVEGNVAPLVSLNASQLGIGNMLQVDPAGGEVTVHAIATDANGDALVYDWSATDNALIDDDGDNENSSFILNLQRTPANPGFYTVRVSVSDVRDDSLTVESTLVLNILSEPPILTSIDSDNDGVVNHLDSLQASNVLQQKTAISDQLLMQTEPGLKLSLGEIAFKANQGRSMVTQTEVTDYSFAGNTSVDTVANVGGYFDFTVSGLPVAGQSVRVVIPQLAQMPRMPVYRKLTSTGWQDFVKDENNSVASATGEEGYCPPPGDAAYQAGLKQGHWCLQLTIEDGGPNDSDGIANNRVTDPGGLGRVLTDVSVSSSGGGAWHPFLPALSIFIMLFFRNISYLQGKRDEYQIS